MDAFFVIINHPARKTFVHHVPQYPQAHWHENVHNLKIQSQSCWRGIFFATSIWKAETIGSNCKKPNNTLGLLGRSFEPIDILMFLKIRLALALSPFEGVLPRELIRRWLPSIQNICLQTPTGHTKVPRLPDAQQHPPVPATVLPPLLWQDCTMFNVVQSSLPWTLYYDVQVFSLPFCCWDHASLSASSWFSLYVPCMFLITLLASECVLGCHPLEAFPSRSLSWTLSAFNSDKAPPFFSPRYLLGICPLISATPYYWLYPAIICTSHHEQIFDVLILLQCARNRSKHESNTIA